ncbi:MAG: class I SAM-dependent DNA methyltransferase, partial [Bacteroidales bacterium]
MEINILNLRNSINKAYLKVKPNRTQIETFKKNITNLFDQIKESESEEFHKNIISEFLKNTYYSPDHYINTKGRADLVIHNGKDTNTPVGVLFETKKPGNKPEMPTCENINTKAFHELILYYLRERISNKNIEVKHLVITNIFEWFIFNASDFEKLFANDKSIVKQFTDFEEGRLPGTNTDFFYKNIAEPFCNKLESSISVTH